MTKLSTQCQGLQGEEKHVYTSYIQERNVKSRHGNDAKNLHRKKKQGGKVMQRKWKKEISLIKVSRSVQL
jgi:hypothetical protein